MARRRYRMRARSEAERTTHRRIITAAVRLHAAQGIGTTSWDEIAVAAGVNRATVYRHFRDLHELIPACARHAFDAIDLPSREVFEDRLADLTDPTARLRRIVAESCACYERGAGWLRAAWREADLLPALEDATRRIGVGVETLVDVALAGNELDREARRTLIVLAGYPFWQQLIDAGVEPGAAPRRIAELMASLVGPKGGSNDRTRVPRSRPGSR